MLTEKKGRGRRSGCGLMLLWAESKAKQPSYKQSAILESASAAALGSSWPLWTMPCGFSAQPAELRRQAAEESLSFSQGGLGTRNLEQSLAAAVSERQRLTEERGLSGHRLLTDERHQLDEWSLADEISNLDARKAEPDACAVKTLTCRQIVLVQISFACRTIS